MDEKKYDLFTNMVQNQDFSYDDLISAGLNSSNTELKDKDTYKRSEKVQELFNNDSGQFDEVKFNNFYNFGHLYCSDFRTSQQIKISFSACGGKGYNTSRHRYLVYTPSLAEIYNIIKAAI